MEELARRWALSGVEPISNMSYNYVAKAKSAEHGPVVLKLTCDRKPFEEEVRALRSFGGGGAVSLLEVYFNLKAMLLEQACPGTSLKEHAKGSPESVMEEYVTVVKLLHFDHPIKSSSNFLSLADWFKAFDRVEERAMPGFLLEKARDLLKERLEEGPQFVLHGDLHLDNIVRSGKEWLAIDPKGILGPLAFEISAFDLTSEREQKSGHVTRDLLERRIEHLAMLADIDSKSLRDWVFLRLVLSVAWFIEDKGDPTDHLNLAMLLVNA